MRAICKVGQKRAPLYSYHQIASKSVNYAIYSPHLNAKETDKTIIRSARDLINAVIDYWYTITLQLTPQKECKN